MEPQLDIQKHKGGISGLAPKPRAGVRLQSLPPIPHVLIPLQVSKGARGLSV